MQTAVQAYRARVRSSLIQAIQAISKKRINNFVTALSVDFPAVFTTFCLWQTSTQEMAMKNKQTSMSKTPRIIAPDCLCSKCLVYFGNFGPQKEYLAPPPNQIKEISETSTPRKPWEDSLEVNCNLKRLFNLFKNAL